MKKSIMILSVFLLAGGVAFADASDPSNAFAVFGNCQTVDEIFVEITARSISAASAIAVQSSTPGGVDGNCMLIANPSGRFEASSLDVDIADFSQMDATFSFYYKVPTSAYSYPRVSLRIGPRNWTGIGGTEPTGEENLADDAHFLITNAGLTIDTSWHQYVVADLSALGSLTSATSADFFLNNYAVPEFYLDEIIFTDPTLPVRSWHLY